MNPTSWPIDNFLSSGGNNIDILLSKPVAWGLTRAIKNAKLQSEADESDNALSCRFRRVYWPQPAVETGVVNIDYPWKK